MFPQPTYLLHKESLKIKDWFSRVTYFPKNWIGNPFENYTGFSLKCSNSLEILIFQRKAGSLKNFYPQKIGGCRGETRDAFALKLALELVIKCLVYYSMQICVIIFCICKGFFPTLEIHYQSFVYRDKDIEITSYPRVLFM